MDNNWIAAPSNSASESDLFLRFQAEWSAMDKPYAVLDLEVTDRFDDQDEITAVHALQVTPDGDIVAQLDILVRTRRSPPPWPEQEERTDAPVQAQKPVWVALALLRLRVFLGDRDVFIHNASRDMPFIEQIATRFKLKFSNRVFDIRPMAQMTWPGQLYAQRILGDYLELSREGQYQGTADDVKASLDILLTVRQLAQTRHAQRIESALSDQAKAKWNAPRFTPALCPICQTLHAFYPSIPFVSEVLELDEDGVEMPELIFFDDHVEIDCFLLCAKDWAAMSGGFTVVHVDVTDGLDPNAQILAITALSVNGVGQVIEKFEALVTSATLAPQWLLDKYKLSQAAFRERSLDLKQALEAILAFAGESTAFIYNEPQHLTFVEEALMDCSIASSMQWINVSGIAQFIFPGELTWGLQTLVGYLGIQHPEAALSLDALLTLKILLATRDEARGYHYRRITTTAPRLENGSLKEVRNGQVFCRFCQRHHPIVI